MLILIVDNRPTMREMLAGWDEFVHRIRGVNLEVVNKCTDTLILKTDREIMELPVEKRKET